MNTVNAGFPNLVVNVKRSQVVKEYIFCGKLIMSAKKEIIRFPNPEVLGFFKRMKHFGN